MENETTLYKGELMEEKLRLYFLINGYYVVRGIKYSFENNEITDIDLFLYGRISSLSRERINVDIKNKKSPKAFERILWAKGLQSLLGFENCVIATPEKREVFRKFGKKHGAIVLDGHFLQKLAYENKDRISEEDFLANLAAYTSYTTFKTLTWKIIYEKSKSRLLSELDFSGFNSNLIFLNYFIDKCFDKQKVDAALRLTYVILSHSLIILDYLLKDIAFLDQSLRREALNDGFKYGNLGMDGVNKTIEMAIKIARSNISANAIKKSMDSPEIDILSDFFSKADVTRSIFPLAIELEKIAYSKKLTLPNDLQPVIKSTLLIFIDFFKIDRKKFFAQFESNI